MKTNLSLTDSFSMAMGYYRTLRKKSIKEIADALEVPATTVSAWNTGRHLPDMRRLQKLANYLKAPIDQFFNFSPSKLQDNEMANLHSRLDTDKELVQLLKVYTQLADDNKHLLTTLAIKLSD